MIDTRTLQTVGSARDRSVGDYPLGIAITPDGKFAYVANRVAGNVS